MSAVAADAPAEGLPLDLGRTRKNLILAVIGLAMLLAALDQTVVSTALPTIVADLGGAGQMAWVVTAYALGEAIAAVLAGKLGDLFGRKRVFEVSAIIFVSASAVAGLASTMEMLIAARAVQGIGGGALMVTAMALIADVIPLRERGKYQGALGAIFGVATVLGPTLGGVLTDYASWRWCFYVNLPVAALLLPIAARAIPNLRPTQRPAIDYAGIGAVALAASGLVLALEWGGEQYAWDSATIVGLFAGSALLLGAFVFIERRAREPMLPMALFRDPVFTVCSALSFVVGFAMLGVLTYLPSYVQYVDGASATSSGIRILPMVVGLLATSTLSGEIVGRTGRYRVFPIVGMATTAAALYLMSTMDPDTSVWLESLFMFVLGIGIGLAMQVLTIVVQNTVPYAQLGTATSGVTFFRTIGGCFGVAIFGALYTNQLQPNLDAALAETGVDRAVAESASALSSLSAADAGPIVDAYADAITHVFMWVVPVALAGFLLAWFLREVPLRDSARAAATGLGEGFSAPDSADRLAQLERALASVMRKVKDHGALREEILADSGARLTHGQAWALAQIHMRTRVEGGATLKAIAEGHRVPAEILESAFSAIADAEYIQVEGDALSLTPSGEAQLERLHGAWQRWLDARLGDWTVTDPEDRELLDRALGRIAAKLLDQEQSDLEPSMA